MKIGEKEFTAVITNRVIKDIEEEFGTGERHGEMSIFKILSDVEGFSQTKMGLLIWHSIKSNISYDDFIDTIQPYQYVEAATEVGKAINACYEVKKK